LILAEDAFERFCPTHVIHSAASYKDPACRRLDQCHRGGAGRWGAAVRQPADGVALWPARTNSNPGWSIIIASYGTSKTAGECYVAMSDLSWVSLRLANIAGPRLAVG
jgi:hypothetical protein